MRILLVSLHTSPAAQPGQGDAGGLNVYVYQAAKHLAAAGHELDILTADPTSIAQECYRLHPGVTVHQLPVPAGNKTELAAQIPALARAIAHHHATARADLIWAHYWISALACVRAKEVISLREVPLVVSFHTIGAVKDRDTNSHNEPAQRLSGEREIAQNAELILANTAAEQADIVSILGARPDAVKVFQPGIDTSIYYPDSQVRARKRIQRSHEDLLVLTIGRMQYVKGTDIVIDAMGELKRRYPHLAQRTRAMILGAASGGVDEGQFDSLATTSSARDLIEFHPPVPAAELADWYRSADLVLVPSRSESYGFVAAEAMACGCPVIASAVGGLTRIVDSGHTGILLNTASPRVWAQTIADLLRDSALRGTMGLNAAERGRFLGWDAASVILLDLLCAQREQQLSVGSSPATTAGGADNSRVDV